MAIFGSPAGLKAGGSGSTTFGAAAARVHRSCVLRRSDSRRHRRFDVLVALALCTGFPASAAPAGFGVSDAGDCELEVGSSWHRDVDGTSSRAVAAALQCGLRDGVEAQVELARERAGGERTRSAVLGAEMQGLHAAAGAPRPWLSTLQASLAFDDMPRQGWRLQDATLELAFAIELEADAWLDLAWAARRERAPARWRSPWSIGLEYESASAGTWRLELDGTGGERPQALLEWSVPLVDDLEFVLQAGATPGRPRARELGMALKFEF